MQSLPRQPATPPTPRGPSPGVRSGAGRCAAVRLWSSAQGSSLACAELVRSSHAGRAGGNRRLWRQQLGGDTGNLRVHDLGSGHQYAGFRDHIDQRHGAVGRFGFRLDGRAVGRSTLLAASLSSRSRDRVPRLSSHTACQFTIFDLSYTVLIPGRSGSSREFGHFRSSTRTRSTSATTNRQSMAIVIKTRIQDDFSSNRLTSFALARPAGRSLRPADRRLNLSSRSFRRRSHARKRSADSLQFHRRLLSGLHHIACSHARKLSPPVLAGGDSLIKCLNDIYTADR
jgi:hypothetical protein